MTTDPRNNYLRDRLVEATGCPCGGASDEWRPRLGPKLGPFLFGYSTAPEGGFISER